MAIAAKASAAAVDPVDRLEEKIKLLVNTIVRLKSDHARASEENGRLQREVDSLKARLEDAEHSSAEVTDLREERDLIRSRVSEMLQQLEGLNL
ncbi:MAG: cell division protein ZapB [Vicinamibacterales bacterium]